jgi:hypothetical protein
MDNTTEFNGTIDNGETVIPETTLSNPDNQDGEVKPEPENPGFAKPDPEKNGQSVKVQKLKPVPGIEIEPVSKVERKGNKRLTITVNFSLDEVAYMDEIIKARIENNLSKNASHFLRQCVDFAIHHKPGTKMAIPDISPVEIKDGFYNPSK